MAHWRRSHYIGNLDLFVAVMTAVVVMMMAVVVVMEEESDEQ